MTTTTEEVFVPINGYEGIYEISNFGRIKRCDSFYSKKSKHRGREKKGMIMRFDTSALGYCRVTLYKNKESKRFLVHRLVGIHFIPNPNNKPQINHIDGNPRNNSVVNLEWTTQSENIKHAYKIGRKTAPIFDKKKGYDNKQSVGVIQLDLNGNFVNRFGSIGDAQRKTGIWQANISKCLRGDYKTTGGYIWIKDNYIY